MSGGERGQAGFTLVEVMVALLIFGMLAAGCVAILSFSVRAQAATNASLDGSAALDRTVSLLSADCAQAVDRRARDASGAAHPAFAGEAAAVSLVRGGWSNLDDEPRPALQKVDWQLAGGVLQRVAYPEVDGAAPLAAAPMLDRVRAVTLRYRYAGAWSDRWDGSVAALPQAMEVRIQRADGREWHQIFLVGGGVAAPPTLGAAHAA